MACASSAAPWEGHDGARQRLLGARNACALAANFLEERADVVITDVLTPDPARVYRELLPGCRVVRLSAPLEEARRRHATRTRWLTDAEFDALHRDDAQRPPAVDVTIDVSDLDPHSRPRRSSAVGRSKRAEGSSKAGRPSHREQARG